MALKAEEGSIKISNKPQLAKVSEPTRGPGTINNVGQG